MADFTGPFIPAAGHAGYAGKKKPDKTVFVDKQILQRAVANNDTIVRALAMRRVSPDEAEVLQGTYFFTHWYPGLKSFNENFEDSGQVKPAEMHQHFGGHGVPDLGALGIVQDADRVDGLFAFLRTALTNAVEYFHRTGRHAIDALPDSDLVKQLVKDDAELLRTVRSEHPRYFEQHRETGNFPARYLVADGHFRWYVSSVEIAQNMDEANFTDAFTDEFNVRDANADGVLDTHNANDKMQQFYTTHDCKSVRHTDNPQTVQERLVFALCDLFHGMQENQNAQDVSTAAFFARNMVASDATMKLATAEQRRVLNNIVEALDDIEQGAAEYLNNFSHKTDKEKRLDSRNAGANMRAAVQDILRNAESILDSGSDGVSTLPPPAAPPAHNAMRRVFARRTTTEAPRATLRHADSSEPPVTLNAPPTAPSVASLQQAERQASTYAGL